MNEYSLHACIDTIEFCVESLHENPFELLGKYIVRAEQDAFFNRTMIDAMKEYINRKGIHWNDKF